MAGKKRYNWCTIRLDEWKAERHGRETGETR